MKNLFGITNIHVKAIEVSRNEMEEVNKFLEEHDGDIIDLQVMPMLYGMSRFIIIYKA